MTATEARFQSAPEPPKPRELRRSRTDRRIAGVCGGVGEYAGIHPTAIRLLMILLTFFGGAGPILYLVGCIAIPDDDR